MTTGAFIAFMVFGFGVGVFALLFLHSENDPINKSLRKHKHIIHKHSWGFNKLFFVNMPVITE